MCPWVLLSETLGYAWHSVWMHRSLAGKLHLNERRVGCFLLGKIPTFACQRPFPFCLFNNICVGCSPQWLAKDQSANTRDRPLMSGCAFSCRMAELGYNATASRLAFHASADGFHTLAAPKARGSAGHSPPSSLHVPSQPFGVNGLQCWRAVGLLSFLHLLHCGLTCSSSSYSAEEPNWTSCRNSFNLDPEVSAGGEKKTQSCSSSFVFLLELQEHRSEVFTVLPP